MRITAFLTAIMALALLAAPAKADPPIWITSDYAAEIYLDFLASGGSPKELDFTRVRIIPAADPYVAANPDAFNEMAQRFLKKTNTDSAELNRVRGLSEKEQQKPENQAVLARAKQIEANSSMALTMSYVFAFGRKPPATLFK